MISKQDKSDSEKIEHFLQACGGGNINKWKYPLQLAVGDGNIDLVKEYHKIMDQKSIPFSIDLSSMLSRRYEDRTLLLCIPHSKLDSMISYLVPYIEDFDIIKEADYQSEGGDKTLPETVLSYLVFAKSFNAVKAIIESPTTSFQPSHMVACSLFRG